MNNSSSTSGFDSCIVVEVGESHARKPKPETQKDTERKVLRASMKGTEKKN